MRVDKEKQRQYMREYKRKQRENPEFRKKELEYSTNYIETVYKEKHRKACRERYRAKVGVPYEPRHDKVCMRCGEAFKAIRSDAMYCNNCKGKKKWS